MRTPGLIVLSLLLPAALVAQETPTERDAARDVVRKLDSLERSLNLPALVARLTGPNAARDQVVARAKELMDTELLAMGDDITRHPEIGFEEKRSIEILTDYLRKHDFDIKMGTPGLPTAFVGRYTKSSGGPVLGVILEYDALRGTKGAFHGDQHSTQGPIGIAAALAIGEYLAKTKTPGTVMVFGTPGEEMMPPNAKTAMFESHVFDGVDVLMRSHSTSATSRAAAGFGTCCMNIDGVKFTFSGAPAHQLTAWNGRNALTAVIHLFDNIDAMRSNIRPESRIQGVITEGGAAPNVVPDKTVADFYVRYPDEVYLAQLSEMVDNAARAAALGTGTKVKIEHYGKDHDGISVGSLDEVAFGYMKKYGATGVMSEPGKPQGYEETGSVSSAVPGVGFSAKSSNAPNHTYEMEQDALATVGHQGFTVDAQSMAALLFDFATRADYRATVKREFDTIRALHGEYVDDLKKVYVVPKVAEP
ncbi:MAG TPA: peptidase dimerization domain-containing protein [Gemmatimonadaceae bacterium]|nr:peptidase dimerization domain-containing protein [Gemmatimonadaceae bacterium]